MRCDQFTRAALVSLVILFITASPAWAVECSDVYSAANGINSNLQASGNTLDLSEVPWANNAWPSSETTLPSGDYYYGTENLGNGYQLNVAENARVRIFINGTQTFANNIELNSDGDPDQFLLVTNGTLNIGNNPVINGQVYATGAMAIGNNAVISGGLAAKGSISIGNTDPSVDYSGIDTGLLNGLCGGLLPVFDNFESYPAGASIEGNNGGINWGGAWNGAGGQSITDTSGDPLEFTDSDNRRIRSETTLKITGNNTEMATRSLDGTFSGDSVFLSMLVRFTGNPTDNDFVAFWVGEAGYGDSPQFGLKMNEGRGGSADFFVRLGQDADYSTNLEVGETYLLVAQYSKGTEDYFSNAKLWVNPECEPGPPTTPPAEQTTVSAGSRMSEFSNIGFRSFALSGSDAFEIGQAAVGTQWTDVVQCSPPATGPDHIQLNHPSSGLTCTPAQGITVEACANANDGCAEKYSEEITVDLEPASGWIPGPSVTFTGVSESLDLRSTTEGAVTLGFEDVSIATTGDPGLRCYADGSTVESNCIIDFAKSGFFFDIPDHISGEEKTISIQALKDDENDPTQCVPAFEGTKDVEFTTVYQNPTTKILTVKSEGIDLSGNSLALDFDDMANATFPLQYNDVGSLLLEARYEPDGNEDGLIMTGQNSFVARPDRFKVTVENNQNLLDLTAGSYMAVAGENFNIEVKSLNILGQITPNFGNETAAEGVALSVVENSLAPLPNLPALEGALGSFGESCEVNEGGKACGVFSWSEVGAFAIEPALINPPYLTSEPVTGERLDYVGRFVPDHFALELVDNDHGAIGMACGGFSGFTYSGQDTGWSVLPRLEIIPRNTDDEPTLNYLYDPFMLLSDDQIVRGLPAADDEQLLRDESNAYPVIVESDPGEIEIRPDGEPVIYRYGDFDADTIRYQKESASSRVKPFTPKLTFKITEVRDDDGREDSLSKPFSINPDVSGQIYYGRLTPENVYGPEDVQALYMPFRLEYWDGDEFVINTADSCTNWSTGEIESPEQYHQLIAGNGTFNNGEADFLELRPKGGQGTDTLIWTGVEDWLRDDLDNDGSLDDPSATATFGVYRGNDRIIYWREVRD